MSSLFILLVLFSLNTCCAIQNITLSQQLSNVQTLISPGHVFELGFFAPNNSGDRRYIGIWYKEEILPQTVVWVANRGNPLRATNSAAILRIAGNGNLELIVAGDDSPLWSTDVEIRSNNSIVTLSDRGNLELKDRDSGQTLWDSFSHPGNTFLSGSLLGFNEKTGENYTLTSWKSEYDSSVGSFTARVSASQKPAQLFVWNGSTPYWRSGPGSRLRFTGVDSRGSSYRTAFGLVEDEDRGTTLLTTLYSYSEYSTAVVTRIHIGVDGQLMVTSKQNDSNWLLYLHVPSHICEVYGSCGPSSVCNINISPACGCLAGFVPKSKLEWGSGNWTQGCRRQKELDCEKNASSLNLEQEYGDGFFKLPNVKLPDLYEFARVPSDGGACQRWCLGNCSCQAFAYVNDIGCLTWSEGLIDILEFPGSGEDLFVRLVAGEFTDGERKNTKVIIISIVTLLSGAVLCVVIFLYLLRPRRTKRKTETTQKFKFSKTDENLRSTLAQHNPSDLPIFDFDTIEVTTGCFSVNNKLGQGGFGPVYKGVLQDGTEIAVKRLASSSGQGGKEFKNEMILISKLQHRNLVKLMGYCIDKEERLLIYEFMPKKSLDNFIFDPKRKGELDWLKRFNILNGIARGLVYLHRDSCLRVIHRDLKVSNILLDGKMNPKISDFGLARIFEGTFDLANTNRIVGTLGYMSPEYAMGGIFSEKSDVFGFGVLTLEMITGRKNTSFHYYEENLSLIAYSDERVLDLVDDAILESSYSPAEAIRCIHVGLLCVQDYAGDRPSMPEVVSMLSNETDRPKPKQPLFTFQRPSVFAHQNNTKISENIEATVSIIEGR